MFGQELEKRLEVMDKNLHKESDQCVQMDETSAGGECKLLVRLKYPSIMFINLEKHKLGYFINKKCADYILFEQSGQEWILHVFELKRTVTIGLIV